MCSVMLKYRNKNSSLNRSKSKKVGTSLAKTKLSKTQAVLGPVQDLQAVVQTVLESIFLGLLQKKEVMVSFLMTRTKVRPYIYFKCKDINFYKQHKGLISGKIQGVFAHRCSLEIREKVAATSNKKQTV